MPVFNFKMKKNLAVLILQTKGSDYSIGKGEGGQKKLFVEFVAFLHAIGNGLEMHVDAFDVIFFV